MITQELQDYIKQARMQGMPDLKIYQNLLSGGWSEADLKEAGISPIPVTSSIPVSPQAPTPTIQPRQVQQTMTPGMYVQKKSHTGLYVLVFIIFLLLGVASGYTYYKHIWPFQNGLSNQSSEGSVQISTEPISSEAQKQFFSNEYYSLTYPRLWTHNDKDGADYFRAPAEENFTANLSVARISPIAPGTTIKQIAEASKATWISDTPSYFVLSEDETVTPEGYPAHEIKFTFNDTSHGDLKIIQKQYMVLAGSDYFVLTATATAGLFEKYAEDFNAIKQSLLIKIPEVAQGADAVKAKPGAFCAKEPLGLTAWYSEAMEWKHNNIGFPRGGLSSAPGKVEDAHVFNGVTAYLDASSSVYNDPTKAGSIMAWVKVDSLPSASHIMQIVGKGSEGKDFDLQINKDNKFHFYVGTGTDVASDTVVKTGTWYLVAGTWDSSGLKMYVNGVLEKERALKVSRVASAQNLRIGSHPYFPGRYFNGAIDEIMIATKAITAEEVKAVYDADSKGVCRPTTSQLP
ncbi:MAG: LamG-like jellyroll fold domain-containing protein [Candidatus Paceibacterota bacterium]